MRLNNVLKVIAFRVPYRDVSPAIVTLFVQHLSVLVRKNNPIILSSTDPFQWKRQIHDYLNTPIPLHLEENVWKNTKGGFGARDIWDLLSACVHAAQQFDHAQERDTKLFSLFVVAVLIVPMAMALLGGKYGNSVSTNLRRSLQVNVPESLHMKSYSSADIFKRFLKYCVRVESTTGDQLRKYFHCLLTTLRLPKEQILAGVVRHFYDWMQHPPPNLTSYTVKTVTELMLVEDSTVIQRYLDYCTKQSSISIVVGNKESVIPIDLTRRTHHTSVSRIVSECTSPIEIKTKLTCDGIIATAFSEGEFHWEYGD
jgi:hypothetical protein